MVAITRRSAVPALAEFETFPRMMREFFGDALPTLRSNGGWLPPVEVRETPEALVLSAELPGMTEKDLTLTIENNVLLIAGEKKEQRTEGEEGSTYHVFERFYGAFNRAFALPKSVDAEKVRAEFVAGVLTVTLPKAAAAKGRVINVTAG
ncbi:MAG: Hsp20/alpha crystallin family protein [Gemmatimonadaceae bacterium]|jgi:HSP20 family protein|nr:Hsp20/alpha crystallin family protein [Gemmatimonadaceae bacterium]